MAMTIPREFEGMKDGEKVRVKVWRDGAVGYTEWVGHVKFESDKGTAAACAAALEAFAKERLAEGYVEVGEALEVKPVPVLDATQLAKLVPDAAAKDDAYLVLADWLQSAGHPWGELIALQHRLATAKGKTKTELETNLDDLLAAHGTAIVGTAIAHGGSRFDWHLGFIRGATIGFDPAESVVPVLGDLVGRPLASQLTALTLSPVIEDMQTVNDWGATDTNIVEAFADLEAIAKLVPAGVTRLGLGMSPALAAAAYVRMPTFSAITAAFPKLRYLEITGWVNEEPGTLDLPALRELVVKSGEIDGTTLEAITQSKLPALERLTVSFGGNSNCVLDELFEDPFDEGGSAAYEDTFSATALESLTVHSLSAAISSDDLETFLAALPKKLKHLGLQSLVLDDAMLGVIGAWPGLAKLTSLDLSGGTLASGNVLAKATKTFKHLALDLERNLLTPAAAKKLQTAYPNVKLGDQRKKAKDDEAAPELFTRFVATME